MKGAEASQLCNRCKHVRAMHDNGTGPCSAGHRGNLGSVPVCDCERMVAPAQTLAGQSLSVIGYARSHLALNPHDLPKILRYLASEQRRIRDLV